MVCPWIWQSFLCEGKEKAKASGIPNRNRISSEHTHRVWRNLANNLVAAYLVWLTSGQQDFALPWHQRRLNLNLKIRVARYPKREVFTSVCWSIQTKMRNTLANNISNWFNVPVAVTRDVKLWKYATQRPLVTTRKNNRDLCVVEKNRRD